MERASRLRSDTVARRARSRLGSQRRSYSLGSTAARRWTLADEEVTKLAMRVHATTEREACIRISFEYLSEGIMELGYKALAVHPKGEKVRQALKIVTDEVLEIRRVTKNEARKEKERENDLLKEEDWEKDFESIIKKNEGVTIAEGGNWVRYECGMDADGIMYRKRRAEWAMAGPQKSFKEWDPEHPRTSSVKEQDEGGSNFVDYLETELDAINDDVFSEVGDEVEPESTKFPFPEPTKRDSGIGRSTEDSEVQNRTSSAGESSYFGDESEFEESRENKTGSTRLSLSDSDFLEEDGTDNKIMIEGTETYTEKRSKLEDLLEEYEAL